MIESNLLALINELTTESRGSFPDAKPQEICDRDGNKVVSVVISYDEYMKWRNVRKMVHAFDPLDDSMAWRFL